MVGRTIVRLKNTIYLFPLAQMEFAKYENLKKPLKIKERLLFVQIRAISDWN
jgi:hypothetical protein